MPFQLITATDLGDENPAFLVTGLSGSGKTTLGLTLPRPTLYFMFDPKGDISLRGHNDVDVLLLKPEGISLAPRGGVRREELVLDAPKLYVGVAELLINARKSGELDKYKSFVWDSHSYAERAVQEILRYDMGKQFDEFAGFEWGRLSGTIMDMYRELLAFGKYTLINTHLGYERESKRGTIVQHRIKATGQLREDLPTAVSDHYYAYVKSPGGGRPPEFYLETYAGNMHRDGKCSFDNVPFNLDVTIKDWEHPEKFGLGKLISSIEKGK